MSKCVIHSKVRKIDKEGDLSFNFTAEKLIENYVNAFELLQNPVTFKKKSENIFKNHIISSFETSRRFRIVITTNKVNPKVRSILIHAYGTKEEQYNNSFLIISAATSIATESTDLNNYEQTAILTKMIHIKTELLRSKKKRYHMEMNGILYSWKLLSPFLGTLFELEVKPVG